MVVQFSSLGSVNEFASRTGQDPTSGELLGQYTAALAAGHRLWQTEAADPESHAIAYFVTDVNRANETFEARHYDEDGKPQEPPHLLDIEAIGESDSARLGIGAAFWLTTRRIDDLEADGESWPRYEQEIVLP